MAGFFCRKAHLVKIVAGVLICCMGGFFYYNAGLCAPASTQEVQNLSAGEKEKLVRQAVAHFEKNEITKAREDLEQAQSVFPENYAVPYWLGLIYLKQGNRQGAIAQWQQYVKMAPQNENVMKIRKNLTLLLRDQAREFARQAVAQEAALSGVPADDKTIAVASFRNLGSEVLGPLGKGMATMLITDLSQVPDLRVVDRIKLHALLEEMKLGTSGLVDVKTAPRVGKLLKAKHITSGSLADLTEENLMIASVVVDTDRKVSIGGQEAQGGLKQFYALEKQIACQIIEDLGKDCDAVPPDFKKIHTKSMPALAFYSQGLDYFDKENYDAARDMFQKALDEDPEFDLAAAALVATPTAAMLTMSISQMISGALSDAPSSATAGTAIVGSSGTGSAVGATATASTVGFAPVTGIAAGAAVLGGGLALAGGGGGGGGDTQPADLNGDWRGTWSDATGASGEAFFSLSQTNNSIGGTVSVTGDDCLTTGNVSGTVSGNSANLTIQSGADIVTLDAVADNNMHTLNGTWDYTASDREECAGGTGEFSTSLTTGGADIHW